MHARHRKILGAASVFHAFNDASVVALPTVFPILYTQGVLIKRYADIGTMILIGLTVSFIFQFIIGHWAKGRHYRLLLALDNLIIGTFLLLTPLASSYFVLILLFMAVRVGASIYHPVGISWICHTFHGKNLDRAMGLQSAFGDMGVLAAFLTTGYLAQRYGWTTPLFVWGALNLVAMVAGLALSRGTSSAAEHDADDEPVSWKETLRDQRLLIVPTLLGGIAWGIMLAYGPSLLNHKFGAPMSLTGVILGGWIGAGVVIALLYGKIVKRTGRYGAIVIGSILTAVATGLIGFSASFALTSTLIIFSGMSLFLTFPAVLALVGSSAQSKNRTAAFSVVSNLQIIGNATFTFVAGFMSDAWGINTPFFLLGAASLAIAIYVVALRKRVEALGAGAPGAHPAAANPIAEIPSDIVS
jgi:MFS family permease